MNEREREDVQRYTTPSKRCCVVQKFYLPELVEFFCIINYSGELSLSLTLRDALKLASLSLRRSHSFSCVLLCSQLLTTQ